LNSLPVLFEFSSLSGWILFLIVWLLFSHCLTSLFSLLDFSFLTAYGIIEKQERCQPCIFVCMVLFFCTLEHSQERRSIPGNGHDQQFLSRTIEAEMVEAEGLCLVTGWN
jgi:hypothetical protein